MRRRAIAVMVVTFAIVAVVITLAVVAHTNRPPSYNPPTPSTYPVPATDPHATTMVTFA